jgi:hypothetical protein
VANTYAFFAHFVNLPLGNVTVECRTQLVPEADRCYIVGGAYTLRGDGDVSWVTSLSSLVIREAMEKGLLNDKHPDILDVHYVSDQTYKNNEPPLDRTVVPSISNGDAPRGDGDNDAIWPWILLSLGTLVLCCFVMWLLRLARQRQRGNIEVRKREQQDRTLKSRTLTFESDGQQLYRPTSARSSKAVRPSGVSDDPIVDVMVPIPRSLDPYLRENKYPVGEQQFYMSPIQEEDAAHDAFDRLLEAVALQDSASSSDGEDDSQSSGGEGTFPRRDR